MDLSTLIISVLSTSSKITIWWHSAHGLTIMDLRSKATLADTPGLISFSPDLKVLMLHQNRLDKWWMLHFLPEGSTHISLLAHLSYQCHRPSRKSNGIYSRPVSKPSASMTHERTLWYGRNAKMTSMWLYVTMRLWGTHLMIFELSLLRNLHGV